MPIEIKIPDIGDFSDVPVIEIFVSPGDTVEAEDPLVSLESDKATMDVPAPQAGKVVEIKLAVGDKVSEGAVILTLEAAEGAGEEKSPLTPTLSPGGEGAVGSRECTCGCYAFRRCRHQVRYACAGCRAWRLFSRIPVG